MADRPRFLLVGPGPDGADWLRSCGLSGDAVAVNSWDAAAEQRCDSSADLLVANLGDLAVRDELRTLVQARHILNVLPNGLAVVDAERRVRWANPTFETWCGGAAEGRILDEALGLASEPASLPTHLQCRGERIVDLQITPISPPDSPQQLFLVLGRDVTALVQQQQKLDALYKAGRELAALSPDQLADMSVAERIELLKYNIRRFTRDLLHYEVIEIRLLDPQTGRLELLLQEGMQPAAAERILLARSEGEGVTGHVAATGKSYLCPDTTKDALYLPGAAGAHSSLTVPLVFQDRVIGTFNVESPRPNAFTAADLQFAELFCHEIAATLHTLELLQAEKSSTASQSVEAISREVALPVDDILAAATSILERYIGHEPEMANKIRTILVSARAIKQCIQKVGEDMAPQPAAVKGQEPAAPALKGMRILVADNDDRVRRSAHSLLGRWGCIVETARDGREALTLARVSSYDAILADIRLPDVSGYEMYRRLREAQPHARVILMTGYGYDPTHALVKARQDGLRSVLFKPFRVDQLRDALAGPQQGTDASPRPTGRGAD